MVMGVNSIISLDNKAWILPIFVAELAVQLSSMIVRHLCLQDQYTVSNTVIQYLDYMRHILLARSIRVHCWSDRLFQTIKNIFDTIYLTINTIIQNGNSPLVPPLYLCLSHLPHLQSFRYHPSKTSL